jgi:hypothetical protein
MLHVEDHCLVLKFSIEWIPHMQHGLLMFTAIRYLSQFDAYHLRGVLRGGYDLHISKLTVLHFCLNVEFLARIDLEDFLLHEIGARSYGRLVEVTVIDEQSQVERLSILCKATHPVRRKDEKERYAHSRSRYVFRRDDDHSFVITAPRYSRFIRAMCSRLMFLGHSISQAPVLLQLPNPSLSICSTMFRARNLDSGRP